MPVFQKGGAVMPVEKKDPTLAGCLSFFLPGLGQFYVGDLGQGFMFLILALICIGFDLTIIGLLIGIPGYLALQIWSCISASNAAKGGGGNG